MVTLNLALDFVNSSPTTRTVRDRFNIDVVNDARNQECTKKDEKCDHFLEALYTPDAANLETSAVRATYGYYRSILSCRRNFSLHWAAAMWARDCGRGNRVITIWAGS